MLDHARDVGAFLAAKSGELIHRVVVNGGQHQATRLVAIEAFAFCDFPAKDILQFAEASIPKTLSQSRER
ncbi:hypothetical protein D3C76_1796620 [compost metagenome]